MEAKSEFRKRLERPKLPIRIAILATVILHLGVVAVLELFTSFVFHNKMALSLSLLLVPIGIGLFKANRIAKVLCETFCLFAYIAAGLGLLSLTFFPSILETNTGLSIHNRESMLGSFQLIVAIMLLISFILAVFYGIQKQLSHPESLAYFQESEPLSVRRNQLRERIAKRNKDGTT